MHQCMSSLCAIPCLCLQHLSSARAVMQLSLAMPACQCRTEPQLQVGGVCTGPGADTGPAVLQVEDPLSACRDMAMGWSSDSSSCALMSVPHRCGLMALLCYNIPSGLYDEQSD